MQTAVLGHPIVDPHREAGRREEAGRRGDHRARNPLAVLAGVAARRAAAASLGDDPQVAGVDELQVVHIAPLRSVGADELLGHQPLDAGEGASQEERPLVDRLLRPLADGRRGWHVAAALADAVVVAAVAGHAADIRRAGEGVWVDQARAAVGFTVPGAVVALHAGRSALGGRAGPGRRVVAALAVLPLLAGPAAVVDADLVGRAAAVARLGRRGLVRCRTVVGHHAIIEGGIRGIGRGPHLGAPAIARARIVHAVIDWWWLAACAAHEQHPRHPYHPSPTALSRCPSRCDPECHADLPAVDVRSPPRGLCYRRSTLAVHLHSEKTGADCPLSGCHALSADSCTRRGVPLRRSKPYPVGRDWPSSPRATRVPRAVGLARPHELAAVEHVAALVARVGDALAEGGAQLSGRRALSTPHCPGDRPGSAPPAASDPASDPCARRDR